MFCTQYLLKLSRVLFRVILSAGLIVSCARSIKFIGQRQTFSSAPCNSVVV